MEVAWINARWVSTCYVEWRRRRGPRRPPLFTAIVSLGAGTFLFALSTEIDVSGWFVHCLHDLYCHVTGHPVHGQRADARRQRQGDGRPSASSCTAQLRYAMDSTSTNTDSLGLRSVFNMTISLGAARRRPRSSSAGPLWTNATTHAKIGNTAPGDQGADPRSTRRAPVLCFAGTSRAPPATPTRARPHGTFSSAPSKRQQPSGPAAPGCGSSSGGPQPTALSTGSIPEARRHA